ncbi:MAG: hypothetical protein ACM3YO_04110 [Bacteroidota bacterium]
MPKSIESIAIACLAFFLVGCGAQAVPLQLEQRPSVSEAKLFEAFEAKLSSKVEYAKQSKMMTLAVTSTSVLGKTFTDWNFQVFAAGKYQFSSLMYLGKDGGIYIQDWAYNPAKIQWFRIGTCEPRSWEEEQVVPYTLLSGVVLTKTRSRDASAHDEISIQLKQLPRVAETPELVVLPL